MFIQIRTAVLPQGYHLLAAALFAPALLLAPPLLALALGVALAAMVVLEVVRLAQLPVIGTALPSTIPCTLQPVGRSTLQPVGTKKHQKQGDRAQQPLPVTVRCTQLQTPGSQVWRLKAQAGGCWHP